MRERAVSCSYGGGGWGVKYSYERTWRIINHTNKAKTGIVTRRYANLFLLLFVLFASAEFFEFVERFPHGLDT